MNASEWHRANNTLELTPVGGVSDRVPLLLNLTFAEVVGVVLDYLGHVTRLVY
jgi:hypothetical protein